MVSWQNKAHTSRRSQKKRADKRADKVLILTRRTRQCKSTVNERIEGRNEERKRNREGEKERERGRENEKERKKAQHFEKLVIIICHFF